MFYMLLLLLLVVVGGENRFSLCLSICLFVAQACVLCNSQSINARAMKLSKKSC